MPGQSRQDRPVGPVWLRAGDLSPQHRDLVTEHHDLRIMISAFFDASLRPSSTSQPKTRIVIR